MTIGSPGPSACRSRETWTCSALAAVAGGSSPHSTSIRRSGETACSRWASRSVASRARCLAAVSSMGPSGPTTRSGPRMAKSIALPMRYRAVTARPNDGGVLTETDHLRESRRMCGVRAFSLTERIGGAHALAPRLITTFTTTEGEAHAASSLLSSTSLTTEGDDHARSPLLRPASPTTPGETHAPSSHLSPTPITTRGDAHALAPRLTTPSSPTRGDAHAHAPHRSEPHARTTAEGDAHARSPHVGTRPSRPEERLMPWRRF